jgi:HlyD family secretion protein
MNQKKYIYMIAGIILLVIIALIFFTRTDKTGLITAKVKKGNFQIDVTTTGELSAKSSEKIYGPTRMREVQIYQAKIQDIIPDGSVVDSGQYVATLDRTEISNKIKDEETNLEKFETQIRKTKLDTSLQLRQIRDDLLNLKFSLEEKNLILEQSKYEPPATIRQVEMDLEKTKRTLDQTEKNYKLNYEKAVANMQEVTASYNQALRKLTDLQDVLKQFIIIAPKKGMLIYKRNYDGSKQGIGGTLSFWDNVVAELPDLSSMVSKTYVNEIDISKVKVGQSVRIGIDAFPEKKFTGIVTEVANIGEQQQNSNAKVFEIKILVNEFDSILRPAMTTKNTIVTGVINNVLSIPIEAIYGNDSIVFTYKKKGGSVIKQQVIVGQSNDNEIIIREGLEEGDEVLLVQPEKENKLKLNLLPKEIVAKYAVKHEVKTQQSVPPKSSGDKIPEELKKLLKK